MRHFICVCTHSLNEHCGGGVDGCETCPCLKFAEQEYEYGIRVEDVEGILITAFFPSKKKRNIYQSGIQDAMNIYKGSTRKELWITRLKRKAKYV